MAEDHDLLLDEWLGFFRRPAYPVRLDAVSGNRGELSARKRSVAPVRGARFFAK
jgi:hypothetical protein